MLLIQLLLTLSALVALAAGIPQMIKLIETKNSDEFNLSTWSVWVVTQSVTIVYAVSISDYLLVSIYSAWVLFYLTMVVLIVKYNPRRVLRKAPVIVAPEVHPQAIK